MNDIARTILSRGRELSRPFREVWVFGSVLTTERPGDIDLLVVYDQSRGVARVARDVRELAETLGALCGGIEVDITAFTNEEAEEVVLLARSEGLLVKAAQRDRP